MSPSRGEPVSGRITPASAASLDWDMYVTGNTSSQLESSGEGWRYRPRQEVDAQQVKEAIDECTVKLEATENALRCRTPTGPEVEDEKIDYVSFEYAYLILALPSYVTIQHKGARKMAFG